MPHGGWAACVEPLASFWSHRGSALGAFVWCGKQDSATRHLLLPLNAGAAEPLRVAPPEAVADPSVLQASTSPSGLTTLLWTLPWILSLVSHGAMERDTRQRRAIRRVIEAAGLP